MIYACKSCGWEFDETRGSPEHRIEKETKFSQLPEQFKCPWCANGKETFEQVIDTTNPTTQVKTMQTHITQGPINRQSNIQELANKYPEAVVVMTERGLHCFGCHGAQFDTVEAGAKSHNLPDDEIDKMVSEMNEIVASKQASKAVPKEVKAELVLTEKAAKKLVELMKEEGKAGYALRVEVVPGGCSGFSYNLDFEKDKKHDDLELSQHGIKIFINKDSAEQLPGAKIDYMDGLHGSGFKIDNPNAHSTCGCGKSFS